jgi:hypothetical protein
MKRFAASAGVRNGLTAPELQTQFAWRGDGGARSATSSKTARRSANKPTAWLVRRLRLAALLLQSCRRRACKHRHHWYRSRAHIFMSSSRPDEVEAQHDTEDMFERFTFKKAKKTTRLSRLFLCRNLADLVSRAVGGQEKPLLVCSRAHLFATPRRHSASPHLTPGLGDKERT